MRTIWHRAHKFVIGPDGGVHLRMRVDATDEVRNELLSYGKFMEALVSLALLEPIEQTATTMAARHARELLDLSGVGCAKATRRARNGHGRPDLISRRPAVIFENTAGDLENTVRDLENTLGDVQNTVGVLENTAGDVENTVADLEITVRDVENPVRDLDVRVAVLESGRSDLENHVADLESSAGDVEIVRGDVQNGVVVLVNGCGFSTSWNVMWMNCARHHDAGGAAEGAKRSDEDARRVTRSSRTRGARGLSSRGR